MLEKALNTFIEKGFAATSIQDLVSATGINRQSLYNEFGDKKQLYLKALEAYCAKMADDARAVLESNLPARMVIENYKNMIKEKVNCQEAQKGCLIVGTIMSSTGEDPEVQAVVHKLFQTKRALMHAVIDRGQKAGELTTKFTADQLTASIQAALTGLIVTARGGASQEELLSILDVMFDRII